MGKWCIMVLVLVLAMAAAAATARNVPNEAAGLKGQKNFPSYGGVGGFTGGGLGGVGAGIGGFRGGFGGIDGIGRYRAAGGVLGGRFGAAGIFPHP